MTALHEGLDLKRPESSPLAGAYQKALSFSLENIRHTALTLKQAEQYAADECGYGPIIVDQGGITGGIRNYVLPPLQDLADEWCTLRDNFLVALQPKMADINGVRELQTAADNIVQKREKQLEGIDKELQQDPKYRQIDEHYQRSRARFDQFRDKHGNRSAVMFAKRPAYWLTLVAVLATECFINYHAFNEFWGVPAVALGTTIILGVLLALAAHGHGELLKQWSFRFGPGRDPAARWTDWRMLGMSSSALFIVLTFTGWARWAAAIETMHSQTQDSLLGTVGVIQVNPVRDVLISLIANIGAWMVGVIISYLGHDADPEYADATRQHEKASKVWNDAQKGVNARRKHIVAAAEVELSEKKTAAETRLKGVKAEWDMLQQISIRDDAVREALQTAAQRNIAVYRDALVKLAMDSQGRVAFQGENGNPLSPLNYRTAKITTPTILAGE